MGRFAHTWFAITVDFASIIEYNAIMDAKLATIASVPVEFDLLRSLYSEYASPKDKIVRLASDGQLIRLKKGLYTVSPKQALRAAPLGLIANRLYGPSYVSMETALYLYQMTPERVYETRSLTIKRSKLFENDLGRFRYSHMEAGYFSLGIDVFESEEERFLIASPTKALCDMIVLSRNLRIQSQGAMRAFLENDLRVDFEQVGSLDEAVFDAILDTGIKHREMRLLKEYCSNAFDTV